MGFNWAFKGLMFTGRTLLFSETRRVKQTQQIMSSGLKFTTGILEVHRTGLT